MEDPANKPLRDEVVALLRTHTNIKALQYDLHVIADSFAHELKVCLCCVGVAGVCVVLCGCGWCDWYHGMYHVMYHGVYHGVTQPAVSDHPLSTMYSTNFPLNTLYTHHVYRISFQTCLLNSTCAQPHGRCSVVRVFTCSSRV